MDENIKWHNLVVLNETAKELEKNGFTTTVVKNIEEAKAKIFELIDLKDLVGMGGSITLDELGIEESLKKRGQKILRSAPGMSPEEGREIRRKALLSDVYMASPNAVTKDGTLLLCDGVGNRVAAMIYGPKKVIAIAGINKIVSSEAGGWARIDEVAAPANAKRLNTNNPCTISGTCSDCNSASRICNIGVVLWKKPKYTEYHIILVPENLGY